MTTRKLGVERVSPTSMYSLTTVISRSPLSVVCYHVRTDCQYARRYVVTATKPVHRLQIHGPPIVHNYPLPPASYIRVHAVV